MDFQEGNENDVLNKTAYFGGANYGFADGSVQQLGNSGFTNLLH